MSDTDPKELALMALTSMGIFSDTFMLFLVFLTFRKHSGLYFWALIGTTVSQILVCISTYLGYWVLGSRLPGVTLAFANVGNSFYVLFEFLVLYSRLHILGASRRQLAIIRGIIIAEWVVVEIPLLILDFYSNLHPENTLAANIHNKLWDVESVLYVLVDCSLSAMYFILIKRMWGEERVWKRIYWNIIGMLVLILCIDATYILYSFSSGGEVILGITLLAFSLKVPVEIYVLNMLTGMSSTQMRSTQGEFGTMDFHDDLQPNHSVGNATMTTTTTKSEQYRLPDTSLSAT